MVRITFVASLAAVVTYAVATKNPKIGPRLAIGAHLFPRSSNKSSACGLQEPAIEITAPKSNIWAQISKENNTAVWNFIHSPSSGLNLTLPSRAKINDNYVFFIDTVHANKSAALGYIDGKAPVPDKYARLIVFEGGKKVPVSQEYMIGPLPVTAATKVSKLDYLYNGGTGGSIPWNARSQDGIWNAGSEPLLASIMSNISDITQALLGGVYFGSSSNRTTLTSTSTTPTSFNGSTAIRNILFKMPGPASYLRPVDFFVLLDVTGTDASRYSLIGLVTNSRFFATVADLRKAWDAKELKEDYFQPPADASWADVNYNPSMGSRPLEEKLAPQSLELGGKRYKVDSKQQYVEYLGWTFYVAHTRTLGLMFYDIRFKGERILYELSMQEAAAQYGGFSPKAAGTVYHDTYFSLGAAMSPLLEGFDCPYGATFWNISTHSTNSTTVNQNAICLFESDMGVPLSRHRSGGGSSPWGFANLGVVRGSMLNVRAIATVGNYDYLFNYAFHLDGSLELSVRASGYLQSSFQYTEASGGGKWGPRIQQATQGSLHDHVLTFKADFDILDTNNSLRVTELISAPTAQPWFPHLGTFDQLTLNEYNLKQEQQWDWPANAQTMYCVNHAAATNKWGSPRGYRLVPGRSNIKLSIPSSPFSLRNAAYAKSHLAITRQHDAEVWANSVQNLNVPSAPQHDFSKFFDGEGVENEDLVVWFNLGMHHFTRSEDIPVTLYSEAVSSIMFAPQNFFDEAQDGDLRNRMWVVPDAGKGNKELVYEPYAVEMPVCVVDVKNASVAQVATVF